MNSTETSTIPPELLAELQEAAEKACVEFAIWKGRGKLVKRWTAFARTSATATAASTSAFPRSANFVTSKACKQNATLQMAVYRE